MPVHEIPRSQWDKFFRRFADRHQQWLVSIELLVPAGSRVQASAVPLRGIWLSHSDQGEEVCVEHGGESPARKSLPMPAHVRVEKTEQGADTNLSIESESGAILLIQFESPVLPEQVDAVP